METTTNKMIEEMITAILGPDESPRRNYYMRESLRALVRQARLEQLADIRRDSELAVGRPLSAADRRKSKAECRKLLETCQSKQAPFRF